MARKMSWTQLQKLPVDQRWKTAAGALYEMRRKGEGLFDVNGIILVPMPELYSTLFTGVVKPSQAQNLTRYLRDNGVVASDGKRGRSGATLRLINVDVTEGNRQPEAKMIEAEDDVAPPPLERPAALLGSPEERKPHDRMEVDSLTRAYELAQATVDKHRQTAADLEVALAIRNVLTQHGMRVNDLNRITTLLKSHDV